MSLYDGFSREYNRNDAPTIPTSIQTGESSDNINNKL